MIEWGASSYQWLPGDLPMDKVSAAILPDNSHTNLAILEGYKDCWALATGSNHSPRVCRKAPLTTAPYALTFSNYLIAQICFILRLNLIFEKVFAEHRKHE